VRLLHFVRGLGYFEAVLLHFGRGLWHIGKIAALRTRVGVLSQLIVALRVEIVALLPWIVALHTGIVALYPRIVAFRAQSAKFLDFKSLQSKFTTNFPGNCLLSKNERQSLNIAPPQSTPTKKARGAFPLALKSN
jgi:hypothetical protein